MKKILSLFMSLALVFVLVGCDKNSVEGITLEETSITLKVGESAALIANVSPVDAKNKNVSWYTDNYSVARVSSSGVVTAINDGIANITVVSEDGKFEATCIVTVNSNAVNGVELDKQTASITLNKTLQLNAIITPNNAADKKVFWSSQNPTIASVSINGLVTAKQVGITTITVKTKDGEFVDSCIIEVLPIKVTSVSINEDDFEDGVLKLSTNNSYNLEYLIEPANASNKDVTWSVEHESIATVDENGVLTAHNVGVTTVTVTTVDGEFTATCDIETYFQDLTTIAFTDNSKTLYEGDTYQTAVVFTPSNASNKDVDYASSDIETATVDESGLITALKPGTVTITVSNEEGLSHSIVVTILEKVNVASVSLNYTEKTLTVADTLALKATVMPIDAHNKDVTWSSSDPSVASVNINGLVRALKVGTTTITVTTVDGEFNAQCVITVEAFVPVTQIELNKKNLEIFIGETYTLNYTILPVNASNKEVTWSSKNSSIATVSSNGLVKGIAAGSTKISVKTKDGQLVSECVVVVKEPVHVTGVSLNKSTHEMGVGDEFTLIATVLPENANNKAVTWESSDESIATVDENGKVSGVATGEVTITVKTVDGNKQTSCVFTITE